MKWTSHEASARGRPLGVRFRSGRSSERPPDPILEPDPQYDLGILSRAPGFVPKRDIVRLLHRRRCPGTVYNCYLRAIGA
jgi:hypothetical protein